ncbi:hypothetical protein [Paraburkholderia sp.]|uniref:hypothetical protein n=1 Tax=Paraburkholderia sp. TaxID=1926495 RepID=UPI0025DBE264|nr:hypothetical protein [Paraburkholderia sp.]
MRFIMTGTVLCVLASTAIAGERYIEIWNPPEARMPGVHSLSPAKTCHAHHGPKRKLASVDHPVTRRVVEPASRAPAPRPRATPRSAAPGHHLTPFIEPQIGPDGNVVQVSYGASAHRQADVHR